MSRVSLAALGGLAALACVLVTPSGGSAALTPVVNLHNQMWTCDSPQTATVVNVLIDNGEHIDAIHLDAGCTGSIVLNVVTNGGDGMKIHDGAHDLTITGSIVCNGKHGIVHQDGVQAMGGRNVLLGSTLLTGAFLVNCTTGNNGGLWVNAGTGQHDPSLDPNNVVADHAELYEKNAPVHIGAQSVGSGVRNSVLHHGGSKASPDDCIRIDPDAVDPVDENNQCLNKQGG